MIMAQDMIGVEKKLCALPKEKKMKERKNHTEDLVGCICVNCMYNSVTTLFNRKKKYLSQHYIYFLSPWKLIHLDLWRYIDRFFSLTNNPSITAALGILAKQIVSLASALTLVCYDWINTMV